MEKLQRLTFFLVLVTIISCLGSPPRQFTILSGSENKQLEPIVQEYGKQAGVQVRMVYKGSIDIMEELKGGSPDFDAVWPANSLWISLGDNHHVVKYARSIMTSPVVFGIRKSVAEKLGFVGKPVSVRDILKAIQENKFRFAMTSATQSNSGSSAYIGFLYALLGNPETITLEDLHKPGLRKEIKSILAGVNRTSGSSGWLKDMFLESNLDAMVNYEALIIEANQELVKRVQEPLLVVYPVDGIVIADSPLGYINKGDAQKEKFFKDLQAHLLSDPIQQKILKEGRRTGIGGGDITQADKEVFNPSWGIDTKRILSPIKMPATEVIYEALNLYQSAFRKPSYTVYCLDFSGSMKGEGEQQLKKAMHTIMDQHVARQYILNATPEDVVVALPFSSNVLTQFRVSGNQEADLEKFLKQISALVPGGNTDIYTPIIDGLGILAKIDPDKYIPAVVLMTDGRSNTGKNFEDFLAAYDRLRRDIPVFAIMFGDASPEQLSQVAAVTRGRVFDGRRNLIEAFKEVKGYQ
ncbi:MAG: VWA domain-containing protein [Desulfobaccales bacterium]